LKMSLGRVRSQVDFMCDPETCGAFWRMNAAPVIKGGVSVSFPATRAHPM
jgi:hypothetical protein